MMSVDKTKSVYTNLIII